MAIDIEYELKFILVHGREGDNDDWTWRDDVRSLLKRIEKEKAQTAKSGPIQDEYGNLFYR